MDIQQQIDSINRRLELVAIILTRIYENFEWDGKLEGMIARLDRLNAEAKQ